MSLRGREESPRQCLGTTFFLSSFEVLYVDITFTKEFGYLYWVSEQLSTMLRMRIAAIYHLFIKVTGYNFNFARAIINLYTKHWAVSAENFGVSFRGVKTLCNRIYGLF